VSLVAPLGSERSELEECDRIGIVVAVVVADGSRRSIMGGSCGYCWCKAPALLLLAALEAVIITFVDGGGSCMLVRGDQTEGDEESGASKGEPKEASRGLLVEDVSVGDALTGGGGRYSKDLEEASRGTPPCLSPPAVPSSSTAVVLCRLVMALST